MRLRKVCLAVAVISLVLALGPVACKKETDVLRPTTYVMNGYESYDDLVWTAIHGELFGEITISNDPQFVTQGEHSAKFALNNESDFGSPDQNGDRLLTGSFKYQVASYDEKFKWLDKIDRFCIDIYNDSDYDLDIYFSPTASGNVCLFTDGAVLAANSWNYLTFDVKPYLLEENTAVHEYVFYLKGMDAIPDQKATLYVDNFRADIYSEQPPAPQPNASTFHFDGIEILNFDDAGDTDFILTRNNASVAEMMPLFYARQEKSCTAFGEDGALCVYLERSHKSDDLWEEGQGYDIVVGAAALNGVRNPATVGVSCFNPSTTTQYVTLLVSSGDTVKTERAAVPAGEIVSVCADVGGFDTIDGLTIRIDSWKLTRKSRLYFGNLQYTV